MKHVLRPVIVPYVKDNIRDIRADSIVVSAPQRVNPYFRRSNEPLVKLLVTKCFHILSRSKTRHFDIILRPLKKIDVAYILTSVHFENLINQLQRSSGWVCLRFRVLSGN